eukprot:TRINITY_DN2787_c1_g5_i2.p1 TRINITY_DN2787_c1_g5~~TRINITY_DN2787_c1_g5_i2.p1  ORF type:complete len:401 (+),score=59.22 TRINITY_DN2787_c1_g5_i2:207-1409(+)
MYELIPMEKYQKNRKIKCQYRIAITKGKALTPFIVGQICTCTEVAELDFHSNSMTDIPPQLYYSEVMQLNLRHLHLQNNNLSKVSKELFRLINLESLNLSKNQIKYIPKEIGRLGYMQRLNLSHNEIEALPTSIGRLVNLFEFQASHNKIEVIPCDFAWLEVSLFAIGSNPIKDPPMSVLQEGATGVFEYLREKHTLRKEERKKRREAGAAGKRTRTGPASVTSDSENDSPVVSPNGSPRKPLVPVATGNDSGTESGSEHVSEDRTLINILRNPVGRDSFRSFLVSEHSEENFMFWEEVEQFKHIPEREIDKLEDEADRIYHKFLAPDAEYEVNIPGKVKDAVRKVFIFDMSSFASFEPISKSIFTQAQSSVFRTLRQDSLTRYMSSDLYEKYKQATAGT